MTNKALCTVCGEPMPENEQVFKFHGYSGPCPKPPLPLELPEAPRVLTELVGAVGLYLGRLGSANEGDKARLGRALDRAMADAKAQYRTTAN
jgi:hypothetical protein